MKICGENPNFVETGQKYRELHMKDFKKVSLKPAT
jgi:hypothetical protein